MALLQFDCKKGGSKIDVVQSVGSAISGVVRLTADATVSKKQALFALAAIEQAIIQAKWDSSGGGALVPDAFVTSYADYPTGLTAVANGQSFAAPIDTYRDGVWLKTAGVGVMTGAQPHDQTTGLLRPRIAAAGAMQSPLVDIDGVDGLWAVDEIQNRASGAVSASAINLLWRWNGGSVFTRQGAMTQALSQTDFQGGTSAVRVTWAAADAANTQLNIIKTVPPGQWTFQFDAISNTGGNVAIQFGTNSTTGMSAATVTTTRQTFTVTATLTAAAARILTIIQGSFPAAAAAAGDITIENVRLVPGASAQAGAQDQSMRVGFWQTGLASAYTGTSFTGGLASVLAAKLPSLTNFTNFTLLVYGTLTRPSGTSVLVYSAPPVVSTRISYLGQSFSSDPTNSQSADNLSFNNGSSSDPQLKVSNLGAQAIVIRVSTTAIDLFIDGQKMHTNASTSAMNSASFLTFLGGISSAAAALWNAVGTAAGVAYWNTALSDADAVTVSSTGVARLAAHSITKQATKYIHIAEGDSITAGTGDTVIAGMGGYASRAHDLLTTPFGPYRNEGVFGATLLGANGSNSLRGRQAADTAFAAAYIAHGWTPILSILIGTNDAASIQTQAGAETYYANLVSYCSDMRAAGFKVIVGTQIPYGSNAAYSDTTQTVVGGAFNGISYIGWRNYVRAMILAGSANFDGVADFGGETNFSQTYAVANAAGYFGDVAHPTPKGHAIAAAILAPVLQSVANSI